jgi:hypothetical protein
MLEAILRKEAHHFEEPEHAKPGGPYKQLVEIGLEDCPHEHHLEEEVVDEALLQLLWGNGGKRVVWAGVCVSVSGWGWRVRTRVLLRVSFVQT